MLKKKTLIALALTGASAASFAASFEGWQASAGIDSTHMKLKGGEYFDFSSGSDQGYAASDGTHNKTGVNLGLAYGLKVNSYVTTLGADYAYGNNTISNVNIASPGTGGPIAITAKNRWNLYVAPGYLFNDDSLAYVKLGYTHISTDNLIDTSTGTTLSGGPGQHGMSYGIGFKQRLEHNSPFFYTVDYTTGATHSNPITNAGTTVGYDAKLKFSSVSVGLGYSF